MNWDEWWLRWQRTLISSCLMRNVMWVQIIHANADPRNLVTRIDSCIFIWILDAGKASKGVQSKSESLFTDGLGADKNNSIAPFINPPNLLGTSFEISFPWFQSRQCLQCRGHSAHLRSRAPRLSSTGYMGMRLQPRILGRGRIPCPTFDTGQNLADSNSVISDDRGKAPSASRKQHFMRPWGSSIVLCIVKRHRLINDDPQVRAAQAAIEAWSSQAEEARAPSSGWPSRATNCWYCLSPVQGHGSRFPRPKTAREFGIPPSTVCNWHHKRTLDETWRPDNYAIHGLHHWIITQRTRKLYRRLRWASWWLPSACRLSFRIGMDKGESVQGLSSMA